MLSSPSASSVPPPPHMVTSNPQNVVMETYWKEVQSIEEEKEGGEEKEEEEERNSMDEVELEEAWLTEAGLSSLVTSATVQVEEELPPAEALLSTLTQQQAFTVRRRLDNYNETLRKRNRQPIRDVRDVFAEPDDDSAERGPSHHTGSPQGRYHTTIKTIRRNTCRVRPTLPRFSFEDPLKENPFGKASENPPGSPVEDPSEDLPGSPPPSNTLSAAHTESPTSTPFPPHTNTGHLRKADWLLRDTPYSEGVAGHQQGGACWDCLYFHTVDLSEQFVPDSSFKVLTSADDLSSRDLTRLSFISHIELSTFLLALGVHTKRSRPPRCRTRDSGVFGVPLNSLLENDRKVNPGTKVPVVFQKLLCVLEQTGLQTEGILRVSGSAARLKYLRSELDRCTAAFDWSTVRQVDASGLLKLFIRELPTPLLTHTHLSTYHSLQGISSELHQLQALQLLTLLLPETHRDTLRALLVFLRQVVSHQDHNRMSLWNVSMVMAPNLFVGRHRGNKSTVINQKEEMEEVVGGAKLLRLMITYQDLLWMVPNFLLSQVRRMNGAANQKQLGLNRTRKHLLKRRAAKNSRDQIMELCEGVIRVHAPQHTKVSMAIQLDELVTVKDVMSRFECENSPVQHLYEVGGNIGERRLHPDCVLLDVYRVNPHCDWLIKP